MEDAERDRLVAWLEHKHDDHDVHGQEHKR